MSVNAAEPIKTPVVLGVASRLADIRNRILANPSFQRWAARFPLTRPIARRHARDTFDLCAGFVYSQILLVCVRLNILEMLVDGPIPNQELAERLPLKDSAILKLLNAAIALDLIERRPLDHIALGSRGAILLGNPGVLAMVNHHEMLYQDLVDPVGLLSGGKDTEMKKFWAYAKNVDASELKQDDVAAYSQLMYDSANLVIDEILKAVDFTKSKSVLDVGGGSGRFIQAVAEAHSHLNTQLFDLPAVVATASERLERLGLRHLVKTHGGDFFNDPLPCGADTVTLVRVLHDHDDAAALSILSKVHDALPPGGRLIIAEPLAGTAGVSPVGDAYFGFYLMAMGSGRPRTVEEIQQQLAKTGFSVGRELATCIPLQVRVLESTKLD